MPYKEKDTGRDVYFLGEGGSGFKPRSLNGHHEILKIKKACTELGELFEDQEFPANVTSIGNLKDADKYIWKRPTEIFPAPDQDPEFIVDEANRFDIIQGKGIGDCWFLAAITDLTLDKRWLHFAVPTDNSFVKKYCGAFHFRFWQYGKWVDVTIDDRLPCNQDGDLVFLRSHQSNEYWGPLLEKAYAKLNGSYEAINGGRTFTGLQDLTGGFTEILNLKFPELEKMKIAKNASELFEFMLVHQERRSYMGSSVKSHPDKKEKRMANGLVQGHAYSITDLQRIPIKDGSGNIELVRLRNPWGNYVEWSGDFSDNSPCWEKYFEPETRTQLQVVNRKDGEFWMTVEDYAEQFATLEICHSLKFHQLIVNGTTQWKDITAHFMFGQWTQGVTAGGPLGGDDGCVSSTYETNPQYLLTVKSENVDLNYVCLMKNERKNEGNCDVDVFSFDVFDITNMENPPVPLDSDFFELESSNPIKTNYPPAGLREVTCRFHLGKGKYVIIPHKKKADKGGSFLLRVISIKGETSLVPFDKSLNYEGDKVEIKDMSSDEADQVVHYKKFFEEVAGEDNEVDWWELKMILDKTLHTQFRMEGLGFSEDECRAMVALYDSDCSGKLGFYEFAKLWSNIRKWKGVFDEFSELQNVGTKAVKTPKLGNAFEKEGYSVSKDVLARIVLRYGDRNGMLPLSKFIVASVKLEAVFEEFKKWDVGNEKKTELSFDTWLTTTMYS